MDSELVGSIDMSDFIVNATSFSWAVVSAIRKDDYGMTSLEILEKRVSIMLLLILRVLIGLIFRSIGIKLYYFEI